MGACDLADNYKGRKQDFTLGKFREFCRAIPSESRFSAIPPVIRTEQDKQSIKEKLAELKKELRE